MVIQKKKMKNVFKIFTLLLFVLSLTTVLTACNDKEDDNNDPSGDVNDDGNGGTVDTTKYNITIESPDNGKLTLSTKSAKSGETVTVTADADLGYKLEEGSLKANDTVIVNGSFTMPAEDVIISAKFVVDGEKLTVGKTNLEFNAKSEGKDAKAHLSTVFGDEFLTVKFVVEDEKLFNGDGVKVYLSKNTNSETYLANETFLVEVSMNGEMKVSKFNGTEFVSDAAAITKENGWFANQNGKLAGYIVELNVPYSLWNLTKEEAKGTLTICPAVLNKNSKTESFAVVEGYAKAYELDPKNHNSFIVLTGDDSYFENENQYPGYYFKNKGELFENGQYWDITADKETSSGPVVLNGHDGMDNNLVFNMSSAEFMYAKTTMKIVDYHLKGDKYLKAGLALFDGQANKGIFYYADLHADGTTAESVSDIKGDGYGVLLMEGSQFEKYSFIPSEKKFDLDTMKATLEIVYMQGKVYFLADGALIHSTSYTPTTSDLRLGVKNFGLGAELTNYYCTTDMTDAKVSAALTEINRLSNDSIWTGDVAANKFVFNQPEENVLIDFYAVKGEDGVYIKADYQTNVLYTTGDWWQQDNIEMRLNSPEGKIKSSSDSEQWILSTNGYSNFTRFSVSDAVLNSETGYYTIVFKAFVSYERLGVTADTPLGFTMGSNPGGKGPGNGWFQTDYYNTGDITLINKITEKGILRYCLEENCSHVFGEYHIVENATCSENGYEEAHCIYCNKVDTKVIESTGEHVYDEENVTVQSVSTCTDHGVGIVACGCGDTKEIELPLDLTNHEGHWNSTTNKCDCGSLVNNLVANLNGPNFHYVSYVMDGTKDFEFDVLLNTKRNSSSGTDWGSGFTGEIFSQDWLNGGWSYRADWCGWGTWSDGGKATYTDVNNGLWTEKFPEVTQDMDIIYNLKYNASEGKFTITMTYISNVAPYSEEVKHLTYTLSGMTYKGAMIVGFGGQNADITFKYIKMVSGLEIPHLDGEMNDAVWQGVENNKLSLNGNNGSLDLHYVKGENGIYFHGYYRVKTSMQPAGGEWWQNHNFEFKLLTANGNLLSSPGNDQWLISSTGAYRADRAFFSQPVADGEYNIYNIEMYISYGSLGITKDTEVGIKLGMNICGQEWVASPNWDNPDFNAAPKIPASVE